ncbi:MAG: pas/pac sensor protein, partial [Marinilabiliales bacterium]
AFMSLIGYSLLNEMVAVLKKSDLISIINGLHKGIIDMLSEHGHEQSSIDDGMDISLLKLNNDKNTIELCCANSTAFICRDDRIEKLSGGICSVGDKRFNTNQLEILDMKIGSNDALYLLSDGYIDQFGGSENQKFMTARFESLINENKNVPLSKQETVFVKAFEDWKGDSKQIDDVLLIGIQFT